MNNNKDNNKKEKSKIWSALFYSFLAVVIIAAGVLFKQYINSQAANNQFGDMQASVNAEAGKNVEDINVEDINAKETDVVYINENAQEAAENGEKEIVKTNTENGAGEELKRIDISGSADIEAPSIKIPRKDLDWDALHEQNADIYAWIYVPDTTVDYPILQHPTDNTYYLNYNIDGTKGFPGCIYTEDFNSKDFSDIHTVIYGHNLKDKTMFTSLHNFENKDLFAKEHYIFIYTQNDVFVYRIFAAYEFSAIHLLDNYDYTNEYVYADYLKQIYNTTDRVANVKADIKVTTDDKIVTLSTCTRDSDAGKRFLVTGVLVNPRE